MTHKQIPNIDLTSGLLLLSLAIVWGALSNAIQQWQLYTRSRHGINFFLKLNT